MPIENYPVWPFEPNWASPVGESVEWLTDIMMSPSGSEQRRCLRMSPRRTLDFSVAAHESERTFVDNMLASYGSAKWYLPIWHDVRISTNISDPSEIRCRTDGIVAGAILFIAGDSPYDFQITEALSVGGGSITVDPPLKAPLLAGARVFPVGVGTLIEEPTISPLSDNLIIFETQFRMSKYPDTTRGIGETGADSYRGHPVLAKEPDWGNRPERRTVRLIDRFDSSTAEPVEIDTAMRPFPTEKFHWILDGFQGHADFYNLLEGLRGRAIPTWVPTWMEDFTITSAVAPAASTIEVRLCGFTRAGGPRPERRDIVIETLDGTRFFRRITASVSGETTERLTLDTPLGVALNPSEVVRVCFINLMRLDHDSIEISHLTDMEGVSEVNLTFRAAPDTRVV